MIPKFQSWFEFLTDFTESLINLYETLENLRIQLSFWATSHNTIYWLKLM